MVYVRAYQCIIGSLRRDKVVVHVKKYTTKSVNTSVISFLEVL